ncbi:hypothetical protein GALL_463190 [mine drainage metagenome]|uniref:Uncharacterized protein n=1 Tax=mine drainage metagenome TaxID=410659 RepID=A0A1J5PW73_9ZZZZ
MPRHQTLAAARAGPEPQQRHHRVKAQQAVKVGAAHPDTVVGQHILLPVRLARAFRRNPHDGKIRRPPTNIDDQHQLLRRNPRLVMQRGGDGFILKRHVVKALRAGDRLQYILRCAVAVGIAIDKMHRAAQHDLSDLALGFSLQPRFQMPEKAPDDVLERHRARAHPGLLMDEAGAERAFQPPHQPPVVMPDIGRNRRAAEQRCTAIAFPKHRAR